MEHSSPVSKIVATSTKTTWAQAYSAGKLHLCLSLDAAEGNIAAAGKEVLEKIQREFFALDEKNLETLKNVVETVVKTIPSDTSFSLILTTIVEDVLYIIIANEGSVLMKRGDALSVIGQGEPDMVVGFSGKLIPDDIVLTATAGLLKTISFEDLEKALMNPMPDEISESLAPFLHDNATGLEAALVWKMIGSKIVEDETVTAEAAAHDPEHPNDTLELGSAPEEEMTKTPFLTTAAAFVKSVKIPRFTLGKRQTIILAVIGLIIILSASLLIEKMSRQNSKEEAAASAFLTPQKQKYDDAVALLSLNKSLAVEELQQIQTDTQSRIQTFPKGSKAASTLQAFLKTVTSALGGEGSSGSSQIQVFFDASKNSEIPTVFAVTVKGGKIAVIGSKKGGLLTPDGKVDSSFNGADSIHGITADEKNVYVLTGDTVEQITKGNGAADTIIQKQASPISIDNFGGNIYLLSSTNKTINKYRPTNYDKENYFTKDTTLANASSMSIDASVYVVSDGKILKFTRGASDSFTYSGKPLSSSAQVYTDTDYTNLYLLDPIKKTATVLSKSGDIVKEVSLKGMKSITGIAADEKTKKMYVAADNKIYSISF